MMSKALGIGNENEEGGEIGPSRLRSGSSISKWTVVIALAQFLSSPECDEDEISFFEDSKLFELVQVVSHSLNRAHFLPFGSL